MSEREETVEEMQLRRKKWFEDYHALADKRKAEESSEVGNLATEDTPEDT